MLPGKQPMLVGLLLVLAAAFPSAVALRDPRKTLQPVQVEHATQTGAGDIATVPTAPISEGFLPLCAEEIVEDTCLLLNADEKHEDGDDWTTSVQLEEQLASYHEAMNEFWGALELPQSRLTEDGEGFWIDCRQLCESVVSYVQSVGVCPEASDISCYNLGTKTYCDLDVRPSILKQQGPGGERDIPDFGDKEFLHETDNVAPAPKMRGKGSVEEERVEYRLWEMVERVANLFRIYPTERPDSLDFDVDVGSLETSDTLSGLLQTHSGMTPEEARLNKQKEELAKAYMGIVIRAFSARRTQGQMDAWFGSSAFASLKSRKEVLRVLNSVDHMISNVVYVYPGPKCKPNTYAYVYPRAYVCRRGEQSERPCTTMEGSDKYVFYLCPLYFKRPNEMVETLVHEGSHHATAYTDDVDFEGGTAYGRSTCKRLARADPDMALKNADNFCYYIQDTATQVSDTRAASSDSESTCPSFARVRSPDRDGDCKCPSSKQCFYGGSLGCPFSATATKNQYSSSYFAVTCDGCSCETSRTRAATTTTTTRTVWQAGSRCPSFAAISRPDSDGDCSCYGDTVCSENGYRGCTYSGTRRNGRYSDLYFSAACSLCRCAPRGRAKEVEKKAEHCPESALMRVPDRDGDCHCPAPQHCTFENQDVCPVSAALEEVSAKVSHRFFDVGCAGCKCVPDVP